MYVCRNETRSERKNKYVLVIGKGEIQVMNTTAIVARSISILRSYYQNDIQPFIDSMHEDIYWYGPCEGQIIHTKKALEQAFMQEQNDLVFELYDLKSELLWKDKNSCEVVVTFLVDTFYRIRR